MHSSRWAGLLGFLVCSVLLSGCSEEEVVFTPASHLEKLRALAVRATPPEIAPGEGTELDALVFDPRIGERPLTYVWVLCDPIRGGVSTTRCASEALASDPARLGTLEGEGVRVHMGPTRVRYVAPSGALGDGAEPGENSEAVAMVLLLVFEGTDPSAIRRGEVEHQLILKRVRITGAPQRTNPIIEDVLVDGISTDTGREVVTVRSGGEVELVGLGKAGTLEGEDGSDDLLVFSWYANGGAFESLTNLPVRTISGAVVRYRLPAGYSGPIEMVAILRDGMGGTDWLHVRPYATGE